MDSNTALLVICVFLSGLSLTITAAAFLIYQKKNNQKKLSVRKLNNKQLPTYLHQLSQYRPNELNADTSIRVIAFILIAVPTIAVNVEHHIIVLITAITLIFIAPKILPLVWQFVHKPLDKNQTEKNLGSAIKVATRSDRNHSQHTEDLAN